MEKIRLLIVDDSFFMRSTLSKLLTSEEIEVVGTAKDGKEAVAMVKSLKPDVVTLDFEMPVMNGLEALRIIMSENPVPVIMVSTLTSEGADATFEALSLGAMDFVTKSKAFTELHGIKEVLIQKIIGFGRNPSINTLLAAKSRLAKVKNNLRKNDSDTDIAERLLEKAHTGRSAVDKSTAIAKDNNTNIKLIAIGISTGGPQALNEMLPKLPAGLPVPIVIVQHMPPVFTRSLAARLDSICSLKVKEAEDMEHLNPGTVYIAPGGMQMSITKKLTIKISDEPKDELFKPSVNVLVNSIVDIVGKNALGIIMTGMGSDGKTGLKRLHDAGGLVWAQDFDSCVISGMPKSAFEAGAVDEIVKLRLLPERIAGLFQ